MLEGVHQSVPPEQAAAATGENAQPNEPISKIAPPVTAEPGQAAAGGGKQLPIDADQILNKYERIGKAKGGRLGAGPAPDFTAEPPPTSPPAPPAAKP